MSKAYSQLIDQTCKWLLQEEEKAPYFYFQSPLKKEDKNESCLAFHFPSTLKEVDVLLLDVETSKSDQELLERLAKAIDERIAKATYFSMQNASSKYLEALKSHCEKVRWILFSEPKLYFSPELAKQYQTSPVCTFLGKPLFLLAELEAYSKDPLLKKNLWSTLLQTL